MSPDNVRERKEKRRFTLVFVPGAKSDSTRTFSFSRMGIIAATAGLFFVIAALVFAFIAFTPARKLLPGYTEELERHTLQQLSEIQRQVTTLAEQVTVLRAYNLQLRKALGEQLSSYDSLLVVSRQQEASNASADETLNAPSGTGLAPSQFRPGQFQGGAAARIEQERSKFLTLPLTTPVEGYLTRGFDPEGYHLGIDIAGRPGTPVCAAADGAVVFSGWTHDDGYVVIIAHDEGTTTVYKHNQALLKTVGAAVKRGEIIALLGNTGERTSGPHLHFEVWKNSQARDPQHYLLVTS